MEDPDIECTAVMPGGAGAISRRWFVPTSTARTPRNPLGIVRLRRDHPEQRPRDVLSDQHLAWIDEWIGRRGGGLCMVGGPNSFASGRWNETSVGKMLPVELDSAGATTGTRRRRRSIRSPTGAIHPIWHLSSDEAQNRSALKTLPDFLGSNRFGRVKPGAEVLARTTSPAPTGEPDARGRGPALRPGPHDGHDHGHHPPLGGRVHAVVGRDRRSLLQEVLAQRRLLADRELVDRPPPPAGRDRQAALSAGRADRPPRPHLRRERGADARLPRGRDRRAEIGERRHLGQLAAPPPHRRARRPPAAQAPLLPWSEEFDLAREPSEKSYDATLPIAEAKSLPPGVSLTQGLRIELTAYENNTQVDSTSLEVQILDDPSEQQNPLPDHDLLRRIAEQSGGTVLKGAKDLSAMIERSAAGRRASRDQEDTGLERVVAAVALDRFADHRMGLSPACRPGVSGELAPCDAQRGTHASHEQGWKNERCST